MKKIITILLFILIAFQSNATTYYVDLAGNNTNPGTIGSPWLTFAYAVAHATTPGDIIHVNAGFYAVSTQCVVADHVSVEGVGVGTEISLTYYNASYHSASIMLTNGTEDTSKGHQSISNIWFDGGSFASFIGILVRGRSYVSIHDCTFSNFQVAAVLFDGKTAGENTGVPPSVFATGNQFYNNIVTNCNDRVLQTGAGVSAGSLALGGQTTMLIHDNTIDNTGKAQGHNGDLIGAIQGNNKDIKLYNNILNKPHDEGNSFNCGVETWFDMGGWEVYGNTYTGGGAAFDIGYGGARKYGFPYSWYFHDNTFHNTTFLDSLPTYSGSIGSIAINIESSTHATYGPFPIFASGDIIISNNHCDKIADLVSATLNNNASDTLHRVYVYKNLCENMGYRDDSYSAVFYLHITNGSLIDSFFIDNNTLSGDTLTGSSKAILFTEHSIGTISNIYFRNNIAQKANGGYGYLTFRGTRACNRVFIQKNITYLNSHSNSTYYFSGTPLTTNFTITPANLLTDPLVNSDYTLKSSSPARGVGISVGYGTDIGAFSYINPIPFPLQVNHTNIIH